MLINILVYFLQVSFTLNKNGSENNVADKRFSLTLYERSTTRLCKRPNIILSYKTIFQWIADIEDLPRAIQKQLFDEILDRDVQKGVWYLFLYNFHNLAECFLIIRTQNTSIFLWQIKELFVINILTVSELEVEEPIVNWSLEMTDRLGSRLYALWNRTAGDCLLDSALQATWGIFDRDNTLRRALADSLMEGANT